MGKPFFSVVVPVYNVIKYLDRCIKSIVSQNFTDCEIIFVDDGSTDGSDKLCDSWAEKDSRIRVVHKQNAGLGLARNTGIENAEGEYILFFDSDDYILPGLFEMLHDRIEETHAQAVFFGMRRLFHNGEKVNELIPNPQKMFYNNPEEIREELLPDYIDLNPHTGYVSNLRMSACTSCLSLDFLRKNNLKFVSEREYISEDVYFFIEMFNYLSSAAFLKTTHYCYCQNQGSLTYNYVSERFERINKFNDDITALAKSLNYNDEVILRLKSVHIATVMACMKMKMANCKVEGVMSAYRGLRKMCKDRKLIKALQELPHEHVSTSWKIFRSLILNKHYILTAVCIYCQYIRKGI